MNPQAGPLAIRPMHADDLATVLALTRLVPEAPWWNEAHVAQIVQPEQWDEAQLRRGWVCTDGQKPVAFIVLQGVRIHLASYVEIECEIESLVVQPEFRCRGIGQSLLRTVLDWCRQNGGSLLRLEVRSQNSGAIRLYAAAGFLFAGLRPGYYHSPPDDAVLMTRPLR